MLCNGIGTVQSMGIGGGFIMNIYIREQRKSYTLNAKEVAPLVATEDMFNNSDEYDNGPKTIGVPGELKGYYELHKKFGSLPWKSLVEPTIELCEKELKVTKHMSDSIEPHLHKSEFFR